MFPALGVGGGRSSSLGRKWRPVRRESLTLTVKTPRLLHSPLRGSPDHPHTPPPPSKPNSQHHPHNYTHPPSETVCLLAGENINHVDPLLLPPLCFLFSSVTSAEYPLSGAFCDGAHGVKRGNFVCAADRWFASRW